MRAGGRFSGGRFAGGRFAGGRFSGRGGFDIASLFANGGSGDPFIPERDFCYTKTSGGVYEPATTTGDEVARLTGMVNGNDADQDVVDSRPVYMEGGGLSWLAFDGVDDFLVIGSRMGIATDPNLTIAAALAPYDSGQPDARVLQIGSREVGDGNLATSYGTDGWAWRYDNGNNIYQPVSFATGAVARWERETGSHLTNSERFFYNGLQQSSTGAKTPSLNNNDGAFIGGGGGGSSGYKAEMDLFGLVVVAAIPASKDKERLDNYLAAKSGVTL